MLVSALPRSLAGRARPLALVLAESVAGTRARIGRARSNDLPAVAGVVVLRPPRPARAWPVRRAQAGLPHGSGLDRHHQPPAYPAAGLALTARAVAAHDDAQRSGAPSDARTSPGSCRDRREQGRSPRPSPRGTRVLLALALEYCSPTLTCSTLGTPVLPPLPFVFGPRSPGRVWRPVARPRCWRSPAPCWPGSAFSGYPPASPPMPEAAFFLAWTLPLAALGSGRAGSRGADRREPAIFVVAWCGPGQDDDRSPSDRLVGEPPGLEDDHEVLDPHPEAPGT